MQTLTLKESIVAAHKIINPEDNNILEKLCELIEQYNIRWITTENGTDPWFIVSDLCAAKKVDEKNYVCVWSNTAIDNYNKNLERHNDKLTRLGKIDALRPLRSKLRGRECVLTGQNLSNFKREFERQHGNSLGRLNSITIVNWARAYAYLTKGHSEVTGAFDELGADAIEQLATTPIEVVTKEIRRSFGMDEADIQMVLHYISGHSGYYLECESTAEDFPQSRTEVRRFDLVHWRPDRYKKKVVDLYELKKDVIVLEDVVDVVEGKRYIELAQKKYTTKKKDMPHVRFVFVAPYGGTPEAEFKVAEYRSKKVDVDIWTVKQLASFLIQEAYKHHPLDGYIIKELSSRKLVNKLLTHPQLLPA